MKIAIINNEYIKLYNIKCINKYKNNKKFIIILVC